MSDLFRIAILAVAFAVADRWSGGGLGWQRWGKGNGGFLPGHPFVYAVLPLCGICYLEGAWPGLAAAVGWIAYRGLLGFPTGTLVGRPRSKTILRHLDVMAVPVFWMVAFHLPLLRPAIIFAGYVAIAVALAKWNGDEALNSEAKHDVNWIVEPVRGGWYGVALGCALMAAHV